VNWCMGFWPWLTKARRWPEPGSFGVATASDARLAKRNRCMGFFHPISHRTFEVVFAVAVDIPPALLPAETGLIVAAGLEADMPHEAPAPPVADARRRALMQRFAGLADGRLAALEDPGGLADPRAALTVA
jgi:hypothetical protein